MLIVEEFARLSQPSPDQLQEITSELKDMVVEEIYFLQEEVKRERRQKDNILCKEKIRNCAKIHNLTDFSISPQLEEYVSNGLSEVPPSKIDMEKIKCEVVVDVKRACSKIFHNFEGFYPYLVSSAQSLESYILDLIKLAPNNQTLITALSTIRENYRSYMKTYVPPRKTDYPSMQELSDYIPVDTILLPSDKNMGPCLLPLEWFVKEYKAHIEKGGYEIQVYSVIHFIISYISAFFRI